MKATSCYKLVSGYDSQVYYVCQTHADRMPAVNNDTVFARGVTRDEDTCCDFCAQGLDQVKDQAAQEC